MLEAMTLPQARVILENFLTQLETCEPSLHRPEGLAEAIRMASNILPVERRRPDFEARLREITAAVGVNPFNGRKNRPDAVWRQCIVFKMFLEGFTNAELSAATKLNHSTITHAIDSVKTGLAYMDEITHKTWKELLEKLGYQTV